MRRTFLIPLVAPLALGLPRAASSAPTFTVDSALDQVDDVPGDGICRTASGYCTLRAAVMEANRAGDPGATIALPVGTYALTIPLSGYDDETTGDLNLVTPVSGLPTITLAGTDAGTTIIDSNTSDRVLEIEPGRIVVISGVTIHSGHEFIVGGAGILNAGTLTLMSSRVTDNGCIACQGGGIYNAGTLTMVDDLVSGNGAIEGGGIYNIGLLIMDGDVVSGNNASQSGGAIAGYGNSIELTTCTLSGNTSNGGGGALTAYQETVAITGSTIDDNSALIGSGGAIVGEASSLMIVNSTIAHNAAAANGGAIVIDATSDLSIASSTINANDADSGGIGAGIGGGIYATAGASVQFKSTILAANRDTSPFQNGWLRVTNERAGTITANGYDILRNYDTSRCTIYGPFQLADPKLGPLQFNGGPTQTEALLAGSPAIDAGYPLGCSDYQGHFLTTDQRGSPRPGVPGTDCDIGAYEVPEPGVAALGAAALAGLATRRSRRGRGDRASDSLRAGCSERAVTLIVESGIVTPRVSSPQISCDTSHDRAPR